MGSTNSKGYVIDGRLAVVHKIGSIVDEKVDALVNTTPCDLKLATKSGVSAAILKAAGQSVVEEFKRVAHNGIPLGQVIETSAGTLCANVILHGAISPWHGPDGACLQSMREVLRACFRVAHDNGMNSIAVPALGTGGLQVPADQSAAVLHQEIAEFANSQKTSPLTKITVVLHPKDKQVIKDFDTQLKVTLGKSKAKGASTTQSIQEVMSYFEGYELPEIWDEMDPGSNLLRVPLSPFGKEYKRVAQTLAKEGVTQQILKMERIQNPAMFREYSARKERVKVDNPGIVYERLLYHGTSADVVDNICVGGFNRSYCGRNATRYGQGAYFAVQPAFAAVDRYSTPDGKGQKFLFQCRVLTGEYCQGKPEYLTTPQIESKPIGIRYDSVVDNVENPGMFVIFRDTQAYPEYLITLSTK